MKLAGSSWVSDIAVHNYFLGINNLLLVSQHRKTVEAKSAIEFCPVNFNLVPAGTELYFVDDLIGDFALLIQQT